MTSPSSARAGSGAMQERVVVEEMDLDAQIFQAELAVIERDERMKHNIREIKDRLSRKGRLSLMLAGAGVMILARLLSAPQGAPPASAPMEGRRRSSLLKVLALLLPLLPGAARGAAPAARGGLPALLLSAALPMLQRLYERYRRPAQKESMQTSAQAQAQAVPPVRSVERLDLARYLGRWYEIARLPMPHEKRCARNVQATYAAVEGQDVLSVLSECVRPDGELEKVRGVARLVEGSGNAHFKVSFDSRLLRWLPATWADYWVLMVAPDYRFALVGSPDRRGLWILSRMPTLSRVDQERMIAYAKSQGYDTSRLVRTVQS